MALKPKTARYLEPEGIADEYGVTRQTVVRWITDGVRGIKLTAKKVGDMWRITQADLDEFFRQTTEAALSK